MKHLFTWSFVFLFIVSHAQKYKELQDLAAKECESGNFKKAIEISGQAITAAVKDKKADPQQVLALKSENAAYFLLDEQVEKGVKLFSELLPEVENTNLLTAEMNVKHNYGVALVFLGDYTNAIPYLERSVELGKSNKMEAEDLVSCLGSLAACYQNQYKFAKAEELFSEAVTLCKKEGLQNTSDHATLQSNFALLYRDMQLPHKAKDCYEKAEKIFLDTKDTLNPQFPVFLLEYGSMLAESFLFDKASSLTYRARNIDRQLYGENSQAYAADLNNLGFIYEKINKIVETEQFYTKSLSIKKNLSYQRLESYLTSLSNLIVFYCNTGRNDEAKELALELEAALKRKDFTDTLRRATFANNLGIHYKDWGNFEKSHYYLTEAMNYYEAIYGKDNLMSAEIYMDLSVLYFSQNKL